MNEFGCHSALQIKLPSSFEILISHSSLSAVSNSLICFLFNSLSALFIALGVGNHKELVVF